MHKLLSFALTIPLLACGDDNQQQPDAGPDPVDGSPDASGTFVAPPFTKVPIAAGGTDQLLGAAAGPNNTFFAVGFRAPTFDANADRELVLVKLTAAAALDTTFGGGDGIASLNVQSGGNAELFRGIAVQSDGKVVVSGIVEDEVNSIDRDVAVVRFDAAGSLDTSFGAGGIVRLDLNSAIINGTTATGTDFTWGLDVDANNKIYVHAAQRGEGLDNANPRTDTDFAVVRLDPDGTLDSTFGTGGKFLLDIQRSQATGSTGGTRDIHVLADGSILASGYTNSSGLGSRQPVIYKLTSAGVLDTSFATIGFFHEVVMNTDMECYGLSIAGNKITTAGYGRDAGDAANNDYVSLRFNADGSYDNTWGTNGKLVFDPKMMALQDNNRSIVGLPGGRSALIGSSGPSGTTSDAVLAILTSTGGFDTAFGSGITIYDSGGAEQFWSGAVSTDGSKAIFVGFRGAGATPDASNNDDAHAVVLPLP